VDNQKHQTIRILPKQLITFADNSADSIANLFISLKFTPNVISFIALILGLAAWMDRWQRKQTKKACSELSLTPL